MMRFFGIALLMLLFLLFLEIMSVIWVMEWLGSITTLILMVLSFITGFIMIRHTGLSSIFLLGEAIRSGSKISLYQMLWPIRYTLAAILLMSPGFVSLTAACILLLPLKGKPLSAHADHYRYRPFHRPPEDNIIEGEYTVTTSPEQPKQNTVGHRSD